MVDSPQGPSGDISVEVYFDATESMAGFVTVGGDTTYGRATRLLENVVVRGWPDAKLRYYKFGKKIVPISREQSLKASAPQFYRDADLSLETHVDQVIDRSKVENLTVILTDLFQTDADVNLLIARLKEKHIAKGGAVGIAAFRSEFAGTVYDVGVNSYDFRYNSGNSNPERFRPFYFLVLGEPGDIIHYFEQLNASELLGPSQPKYVLLSRNLVSPSISFNGSRMISTRNLVEVSNILVAGVTSSSIKQFEIRDKDREAGLGVILSYKRVPYTLAFENGRIEADVKALRLDGADFVEDDAWNENLVVQRVTMNNGALELEAVLEPMRTGLPSIHSYEVILRPKADARSMPDWVRNWTMDSAQIEKWKGNPGAFNGATTLNLSAFLDGLWQVTAQITRPEIARLYFYIRRR